MFYLFTFVHPKIMQVSSNKSTFLVVPEIDMPQNELEKFRNSDKGWDETNLGSNDKSNTITFDVVSKALDKVYTLILGAE